MTRGMIMIIRWWLMVMISNIGAGDDGEDDQSYRFLFSSGWKKLRAYHPRWKSKPCHRPFPWLIWLILDTLWKHILSAGQWVPLLIQIAPIACSRAEKNHQKICLFVLAKCSPFTAHLYPFVAKNPSFSIPQFAGLSDSWAMTSPSN